MHRWSSASLRRVEASGGLWSAWPRPPRPRPPRHPPPWKVCASWGGGGLSLRRGPLPTSTSCPSRPRPPDRHLPGTLGEEPTAVTLPCTPPLVGGRDPDSPSPLSSHALYLSPHAVLSRPCLGGSLTTGCLQPSPLPDLSMTCRYRALLALLQDSPTSSCHLSAVPVTQPCPFLWYPPCLSVASPVHPRPILQPGLGRDPPRLRWVVSGRSGVEP